MFKILLLIKKKNRYKYNYLLMIIRNFMREFEDSFVGVNKVPQFSCVLQLVDQINVRDIHFIYFIYYYITLFKMN